MSTGELYALSACDIVTGVKAKTFSPVEVVDAVLARMEAIEPEVYAYCLLTAERARSDAKRIERAVLEGEAVGPLAGVPVSIKDLIFTKGVRTAGGSLAYANFVPDEDDVAVERIKQADGIILGKTTVPEFGYSGTSVNPVSAATHNPWKLGRTPGGSSSGSAAAVCAGMGPLTLGSDGGGSVRIPASFCSLYGIKPSMGRVPLYPGCREPRFPGFSSWETLEHLGPLSRTVDDSALMLSVIAGPDGRDRHSLPTADFDWLGTTRGGIAGSRIAYSEDLGYAAVDPEVRSIVRSAVTVFAQELGCDVDEVDPGFADPAEGFQALVIASSDITGMRAMAAELGGGMSKHLSAMLAADWTVEQLSHGEIVRKEVACRMAQLMSHYDLLLTPTVGTTAFELGPQVPDRIEGRDIGPFDLIAFAAPFNMTGQPAASVPAGWTQDGLPVGLQIVGRHLADDTVLHASAAYERARPWADRWPSLKST